MSEQTVENRDNAVSELKAKQLRLQVYLTEYDTLQREHDLHLKIRQELGVYTLIATVTLIAAFVSQVTSLTNESFLDVFLVMPGFFTLMTWWFIRTNYSAALIDEYLLTVLQPKVAAITEGEGLGWVSFLYRSEFSKEGWLMVGLQTVARLCLIQGPALLSLLIFWFRTHDWMTWGVADRLLIIMNLVAIMLSGVLIASAWSHISRIRKSVGEQKENVE